MCAALDGLSDDYSSRMRVPVDNAYVVGPEDAAVTIVEFSDFQCPYCARVIPTLESLIEEFGGRIRIAFRHNPLPFHTDAPLASQAALAAGEQGKFWEMHNLLFENQGALDRASIERYAEQLGLDMAAFRRFLDESSGQATIDADQALAARVGARGTPNFFINGRSLRGAQPIERFREMINEELALADRAAEAGLPSGQLYACLMARAMSEAPAPTGTVEPARPSVVTPPPVGDAPFMGPADAPITIVAFSDFECPFCDRVRPTLDQIREAYPDQVRIVFKHFPLPFHTNAHAAAQASVAAHAQGQFWAYHDLLFENMRAHSREDLERYAEQLGLDMVTFRAALDGGALSAQVDADMEQGRAAGISGTPSFVINGEVVVGAQPFEAFRTVIERQLGGE